MSKTRSNLRFKEFAKAVAAGAFVGAVALQPVTAGAATGSVQVTQANAKWFVNTNITFSTTSSGGFAISSASLHTAGAATANSYNRNDAYDGAFSWHVYPAASVPPGPDETNGYRDPSGVVSTNTTHGTTLTGSIQVLAGLNVSGELYFSPTKAVVRTTVILQNPTGAPIDVVVGNYSNLGSDNNTHIVTTSSGDATFDATDNWFTSCQTSVSPPACDTGPSGPDDPVLTYALQDSVASVRAVNVGSAFANGSNYANFNYAVTVPAGATRRVMMFGQLSDTAANAQTDAALFNSTNALRATDYLYGLSSAQLSQVVNWSFAAPTPVVPAPTLGRWALLLLGALVGWTVRFHRRAESRR